MTKKQKESRHELARCLIWAMNNLKTKSGSGLIQNGTIIYHWTAMFEDALEGAGYRAAKGEMK